MFFSRRLLHKVANPSLVAGMAPYLADKMLDKVPDMPSLAEQQDPPPAEDAKQIKDQLADRFAELGLDDWSKNLKNMDKPGKIDEGVYWTGWGKPAGGYGLGGKSPTSSMVIDFGPRDKHTLLKKVLGPELLAERQKMRFKARRDRLPWYASKIADEDLPLMLKPTSLSTAATNGWSPVRPDRSVLFFNPGVKFKGTPRGYSYNRGGAVVVNRSDDLVHEIMPGHDSTYPIADNPKLYEEKIKKPIKDLLDIHGGFDEDWFFDPKNTPKARHDYVNRYNAVNNHGLKTLAELSRVIANNRDAVSALDKKMPSSFYSLVERVRAHRDTANKPGSLLYGSAYDHDDFLMLNIIYDKLKAYDKAVEEGTREPDPKIDGLKEELDYLNKASENKQPQPADQPNIVDWARPYVNKQYS